jgi:hypothetical protein
MYATALRFVETVLNDQSLNDFFIRETQRSLRKVYFEPSSSTPEVSIELSDGGQIAFNDGEKLCRFTLNFCLPLYSDESARVALEFLDLFYYAVMFCHSKFYKDEREAGRAPRLKLYGMSPGVANWHVEEDFCRAVIVLALGIYED